MNERDKTRDFNKSPGPVITISRQHGCEATKLANQLIKIFTKHPYEEKEPWKFINKEILRVAAEELHVTQNRIRGVMDSKQESLVGDLFSSFGQPYGVGHKQILETVHDVIESYAMDGHVIVIGRGGAIIGKDIENSFHIKLHAPKKWRIRQIEKKFNLSNEEATMRCEESDSKRQSWNEQLAEGKYDQTIYDLILNCQTLSNDQITKIILAGLESKGMIRPHKFALQHH